MNLLVAIVCTFVAFVSTPLIASDASRSLSEELAKAVDAAVEAERKKQEAVGVAIGIVRDGKIVYLKGYGEANREKKIPVTTETVFNWASNSKPVAAVLAMQLVESHRLDLDRDVRKYVPEFPDKGAVITARHLLTHQSGLPHYRNGKVISTKRKYRNDLPFRDPVLALDRFNRSPLIFAPGEKTDYSSYAYILLSAVIQKAGKEPFYRQVEKRITGPLSLKSFQEDFPTNNQPHWSQGYIKVPVLGIMPAPEDANYWKHGAGGFKSNVKDFARWAQALINGELVGEEATKLMWTAQPLADGKKTNWGLGFILSEQGGLKVSHNGSQAETRTRMVLYPEKKHGVVVMSNCQFVNPGAFSTAIYRALNP